MLHFTIKYSTSDLIRDATSHCVWSCYFDEI